MVVRVAVSFVDGMTGFAPHVGAILDLPPRTAERYIREGKVEAMPTGEAEKSVLPSSLPRFTRRKK